MKSINIQTPKKVNMIIEKLIEHGYEAYAVGGCVRDSLLKRKPSDWDITTSAKPGEVKNLFSRTIDTGIQHGTVTVMLGKEGFEVTTYRIDGEYEDSRHPKEIIFTSSLTEDLKRRDFTINALAYNQGEGLVDQFHGIQDLDNHIVRCVGNPYERFTEDALRILRAVRFSAQLGFLIEQGTEEAIRTLAPNLCHISAERIQVELVKLLVSSNPEVLKKAYETGITAVIMPELDEIMNTPQNHPYHCYSAGEHTLHSLTYVEPIKHLRLTMLFHDMGKAITRSTDDNGIDHFHKHAYESERLADQILHRLKFDNDTIYKVKKLVKWHDYHPDSTPKGVRRSIYKVGEDIFPDLLKVQKADILAGNKEYIDTRLETLDTIIKIYNKILEENDCISLKTLNITGADLIQLGIKQGKPIGEILKILLDEVIDSPEKNEKIYLQNRTIELAYKTEPSN